MSNDRSRLELLPDEILIEIFRYFDARDLFRAFYSLNLRFNELLQTLNDVCLILSIRNREQISTVANFLPYIHTLIVRYKTDVIFNY